MDAYVFVGHFARAMPLTSSTSARLLDRLGLSVSVLCLVHCLVLPFALVGLSVWGASGVWTEVFHWGVVVLALPAAVLTARPGYREHRRAFVPALLLGGAALLVVALALHDVVGEVGHVAITAFGSALLVAGHLQNYRLRARCTTHALPHHEAHHGS